MNWEIKRLAGRALGELCRLQRHAGLPTESDATIYGLLHGMEHIIDGVFAEVGFVSWERYEEAMAVLTPHFQNPEKRAALTKFDVVENELLAAGVDREAGLRTYELCKITMGASSGSNTAFVDNPEAQRSLLRAMRICLEEDEAARAPQREIASEE